MKYLTTILALALILPLGSATSAQRNSHLESVLAQLNVAVAPEALKAAPIPGFLEVVRGTQIFYVSTDGTLLIDGEILSIATETNLTERTRAAIRRELLSAVSPRDRIIVPADNVRARIVVFTDTGCPFCQKLHERSAEFAAHGIEIQYLLYPRPGPQSASFAQAVAVWCSADRLSALDAALSGTTLATHDCENPVMEHYDLARRLELRGTPAIIAPDGSITYGVPSAEALSELARRPSF